MNSGYIYKHEEGLSRIFIHDEEDKLSKIHASQEADQGGQETDYNLSIISEQLNRVLSESVTATRHLYVTETRFNPVSAIENNLTS